MPATPTQTLFASKACRAFCNIALCLVLCLPAAWGSQNGRDGFSGNPQTNNGASCAVCHAPADGTPVPNVTLSGPTVVEAGASYDFQVTVTGGPAQTGGVNISVSDAAGTLAPLTGDLAVSADELAHTTPKTFTAGTLTFDFRWTAPEYNADIVLYAAGNSSNGALDLLGDGIGEATLTVTVQNGGEPPPPPPAPPPAEITLTEYASGFDNPVAIAHAGDDRLFIVEQAGRIRVIDSNGTPQAEAFLDIAAQVDDGGSEMGLLGLAFHPNYAGNGYFYVYYTFDPGPGPDRSRVSRFTVSADPNRADSASERVLLEFEQPFANHNGGDLHFGPDGYLYIASGDGGSGGDPFDYAQTDGALLGKLLRINVDGVTGNGPDCDLSGNSHYRIPPDNAFTDGPGGAGCDEIYAAGLRNPWRFSFDRLTGDLWIGDVGQNAFEEIDFAPAGAGGGLDFGWRCYEGNQPFDLSGCDGAYLFPVHDFAHAEGNCSVTGGFVYRGARYPVLAGRYFFTDFCNSAIRTLSGPLAAPSVTEVLPSGQVSAPAAFGEDAQGELYLASLSDGIIYRIRAVLAAGDIDADGDVDRDDLRFIRAALSTPANGANDPRDLDGDGWITRLDARLLIQQCTEPRCARG